MKYNDILHILSQKGLPLADIKDIFDGYFKVEFDRLGIIGEEECQMDITPLLEKIDKHYQISYLVGYTYMAGMRIYLNQDTLIPRIETEDFILNYLNPNYDLNGKEVLDLCTGSGFIALLIKKLYPKAIVTGSDIVLNALEMAKKNAQYNDLNISFVQSDFLFDIHQKYDFIVSNPPYIEVGSKDVFAPYEPELALFSGVDGLDSYRAIFKELDSHLKEGGQAFFELESTNSKATFNLFRQCYPSYDAEVIQDLYKRDRYLVVKKH